MDLTTAIRLVTDNWHAEYDEPNLPADRVVDVVRTGGLTIYALDNIGRRVGEEMSVAYRTVLVASDAEITVALGNTTIESVRRHHERLAIAAALVDQPGLGEYVCHLATSDAQPNVVVQVYSENEAQSAAALLAAYAWADQPRVIARDHDSYVAIHVAGERRSAVVRVYGGFDQPDTMTALRTAADDELLALLDTIAHREAGA
jgi:hypothetical protein